jgi:hypothetical protein
MRDPVSWCGLAGFGKLPDVAAFCAAVRPRCDLRLVAPSCCQDMLGSLARGASTEDNVGLVDGLACDDFGVPAESSRGSTLHRNRRGLRDEQRAYGRPHFGQPRISRG